MIAGAQIKSIEPVATTELLEFCRHIMSHDRLVAAMNEVLALLPRPTEPGPDDVSDTGIVLLFGPTGVGKTTLIRAIERHVADMYIDLLATDPGRLISIGVRAKAPERGAFDWRDFYVRLLLQLQDPLVGHRRTPPDPGDENSIRLAHRAVRTETVSVLRRGVEIALRHRRPLAVFIDDAHVLARVASGQKPHDQLDTLRCLADEVGVVFVLVGTYDLEPFRNLSGQLVRRGPEIHFGRYLPSDHAKWSNIVEATLHWMPFRNVSDLVEHADYFYEWACGCVGVFKTWCIKVARARLRARAKDLELKDFERWAFTSRQLERLALDIALGESHVAVSAGAHQNARYLLGLDNPPDGVDPLKEIALPSLPEPIEQSASRSARGRPTRPGRTKPHRHPVGPPPYAPVQ